MDEYNNNQYNRDSDPEVTSPPNQWNQNTWQQPPYYTPQPQRSGLGWKGVLALVLCCSVLGGALGWGLSNMNKGGGMPPIVDNGSSSVESSRQEESSGKSEESDKDEAPLVPHIVQSKENLTVAQIAEKAAPSVVEIITESVQTGNTMSQYISSGAGSGVIISENGYIITNNHVINGATKVTVTTTDGTAYDATIVGLDEDLDVALLKVDASDLTAANISSSENLVVGQDVVAIGNPLGQLGGTVTNGIISALDRSITIDDTTMNLLQTNAAINPGNSGGGLFDASGNLIGLVVAKYSDEEVEGLGFAIPIDDIVEVLDDLKNHGYVTGRASLGVSLLDINSQQMAWMYRVNRLGVYVYSVVENSAADKAGLRSGDLLLTFNSADVESSDTVAEEMAKLSVGDVIEVKILRNNHEQTLSLTIGEYVPEGINRFPSTH